MHVAVILANAAFAAIFLTIALSGFHRPAPHAVPLGIVASAPVAREIKANLDAHVPGGFELRSMAGEPQARAAIEHRRYPTLRWSHPRAGWTLLTAEAGGTAPTQTITDAFTEVAAKTRRPLATIDVVPPTRDDSQALSSFFLILCVLFPSLATVLLLVTPCDAPAFGPVSPCWLPSPARPGSPRPGSRMKSADWATIGRSLGSWPCSRWRSPRPTAALGQIRPHLAALCVLAFLIVGIPVSGGPPNLAAFDPGFLRSLHSGLPLGLAVDSIRNTVYFHASETTGPLWVLTAYAAGGLTALCVLVAAHSPATVAAHPTATRGRRELRQARARPTEGRQADVGCSTWRKPRQLRRPEAD